MSLFLGIYSKKNFDNEEVKEVIDDFSLNGKRKIESFSGKKFSFSLYKNDTEPANIKENEDKSKIIILGGEIYGFGSHVNDLTKKGYIFKNENDPVEFLLHSYEEFGESFLKNINGNFALAIYDRSKDELILGNDPFGIYPLFIYHSKNYIIFSSEYEPITKFKNFDKELNYDAIAEFITLGMPLENKTFFKNIENLRPGSILAFKDEIKFKKYDDLNIKINKSDDQNEYSDILAKKFKNAVHLRVKDSKIKICRLSGGADTRLILSTLTKEQRESLKFITHKNPVLNEDDDKDVIIRKLLSDKLNLNLQVIEKDIIGEDFGSSFFDKKRNAPNTKSIGGWYGGEFLGGLCFSWVPIRINKISRKQVSERLKKIFNDEFLKKISNPYDSLLKELDDINTENKELLFCIKQYTRGFFTNFYMGSRSGWLRTYDFTTKVSVPFLDTDFLKALLTIPPKHLLDYKIYYLIYKNHFPELMDVPTNSVIANLKDSHFTYIKEGKEPKQYIKQRYDKALNEYINSEKTWHKSFYNKDYIIKETKTQTKSFNKYETMSLFTAQFIDFEAWYRKYVD